MSAVNLGRLLVDECGLPAEWLHVLPGKASEVGEAIVGHADVPFITFTGSPEVGWGIRQRAYWRRGGWLDGVLFGLLAEELSPEAP